MNLKEHPEVERFRKVRAGNARIKEAVVQHEPLVTMLGVVGF